MFINASLLNERNLVHANLFEFT